MCLRESSGVRYGLLGHPRFSHGPHFSYQFITKLHSTVLLVAGMATASALHAIPGVIGMAPIFKMIRIHALPVVALVSANLRPVSIPEEEGQSMRKNALLSPAQLSVSSLVQELVPLPAVVRHLGGTRLNIALRERLDVHNPIVSHINS